MKIAVIYARVSSEQQKEANTIASQTAALTEFAQKQGYDVPAEYVFRFNRRFHPMTGFNSILGLAVKSVSTTYEELYSGAWKHPGGCHDIDFS